MMLPARRSMRPARDIIKPSFGRSARARIPLSRFLVKTSPALAFPRLLSLRPACLSQPSLPALRPPRPPSLAHTPPMSASPDPKTLSDDNKDEIDDSPPENDSSQSPSSTSGLRFR